MKNKNYTTCPKCGTDIPEDAPGGLCPTCVLGGAITLPETTAAGGKKAPPPSVEEIAPHLPDLEIVELLGAGGMGAVYKARQPQLDRTVAVKILSDELAKDPAFVERFNREARVLARMSHPNIVGIFDFGTAGPYCYLLMEYVDGVNLRQAMRTGGFTAPEALALVQEICSALEFAHQEGILHRDIKPENVLINSKGQVKIADFGIAKLLGESEHESITLTMQGSILGSPHYMAPEQIETPDDVDQRADIYSLGVVLYEMLTGELPIGRFAAPSEKATIDSRIDAIVFRTLEKERQARYQSAGQMMTDVETVTQTPGAAQPSVSASEIETDPGPARFSLTSALLTGFSLIAAVVAFVLLRYMQMPAWGMLIIGLGFVVAAGTALTGFLLGAKAMGDVRKSGGQKSGLGFAIFATVTWPLLILPALSSNLLFAGVSMGTMEVMLIAWLCFIPGAILLVRGLWRWARGVQSDESGNRNHPGFGKSLFLGAGLIVIGPVLLQYIVYALFFSQGRDQNMGLRGPNEFIPAAINSQTSSGTFDKETRSASYEIEENGIGVDLELTVAPNLIVTYELIQTDAVGKERIRDEHQGFILTSDKKPWNGTVKIATIFFPKGPPLNQEVGRDMVSLIESDSTTDEQLETFRTFVFDYNWNWNEIDVSELTLDKPGMENFEVAARSDLSETLSLRVVARKREIPGVPAVALEQLKLQKPFFGLGGEVAWYRFLMEELNAQGLFDTAELEEPEWQNGRPEKHVNLTVPPGMVATLEMEGPEGVIQRGYIVASDLAPWVGKMRVGSLADSSKLQWRIEGPDKAIKMDLNPPGVWKLKPHALTKELDDPGRLYITVLGDIRPDDQPESESKPLTIDMEVERRRYATKKYGLPEVLAVPFIGFAEGEDWAGEVKKAIETRATPNGN